MDAASIKNGLQHRLLLISLAVTLLSLALPIALLQVYDRILPNQGVGTAWVLGLGVLTAMLLEAGLRYGRSWMLNRVGMKFDAQSSVSAMSRLLNAPDAELKKLGHVRIEDGFSALKQLREYQSGQALLALYDAPFILLFLALITYVGGAVVLIPLMMLLLASGCVYLLGRDAAVHAERVAVAGESRAHLLREVFRKILPYKGLALEGVIASRFEKRQKSLSGQQAQLDERVMQIQSLTAVFSQATTVMVVMFSAHLVIAGDMSSGALAACTLLAGRCMAPVGALFAFWGRHQSTQQAFAKAEPLLQLSAAKPLPVNELRAEAKPVAIGCHDLKFVDCDKSLSFQLPAGHLAILTPDEELDWSMLLNWLRNGYAEGVTGKCELTDSNGPRSAVDVQVALVPRRVSIFPGTVLENLSLFNETRTDSAQYWAKQLGLHARLIQLPQGYHTNLAQGVNAGLDRGTIQLIGLARALTSEPDLLLLDNADVGLDIASQKQLAAVLEAHSGGFTGLIATNSSALLSIAPLCELNKEASR